MRKMSFSLLVSLLLGSSISSGCASVQEQEARQAFQSQTDLFPELNGQNPDDKEGFEEKEIQKRASVQQRSQLDLEKGLPAYLEHAMQKSPRLRSSFEQWRASILHISSARKLPEPQLVLSVALLPVETRVGPQWGKVRLQQSFPWPTKLLAGADAASAEARSNQELFQAEILALNAEVQNAYWNLWELRRTHMLHKSHVALLQSLASSTRARLITGKVTLAELQQIDLASARVADMLSRMLEEERVAIARLRAVIGDSSSRPLPTPGQPQKAALPKEGRSALAKSVREHPLLLALFWKAIAFENAAEQEGAARFPSFTLAADWMVTGPASAANDPDSGKQAVFIGVGVQLPVWQNVYADRVASKRAQQRSELARRQAAIFSALALLEKNLSQVREAHRRIGFYQHTLVPQAESAFASVLGAFATGQGSVAQTLIAQRELLDLRVELEKAKASYARGWAQLEGGVGREVERSSQPVQKENVASATSKAVDDDKRQTQTPTPSPAERAATVESAQPEQVTSKLNGGSNGP
ncbi:MAG: TolC family protein [Deltaproteobacteria bacterium]|nr:TolC family protein [Deltaproteobacteria bacterium]